MPLTEIRVWRVTGESIDSATLIKQLAEANHLFAVEMDTTRQFSAIDPYYAEMLRPGSIVLYLAPGSIKKPKGDAAPGPAEAPALPKPAPPQPVPKN